MDDIIRKDSPGGSLSTRLRREIQTLRQQKADIERMKDTVLLLDVSGSMAEEVGSKRKIDHLREAVEGLPGEVVSFSSTITVGSIPEPQSSTDMALGIQYLSRVPSRRALLVSDGLPDSTEAAFAAAQELGRPIDIIYIGPPGSSGEEFLSSLAKMTGGRQITVDTRKPQSFRQELSGTVNKLLLTTGGKHCV